MAALFNPFRLALTYEAGEEVLNSYMAFGESQDSGIAAQLDDDSLDNINTWVAALATSLAGLTSINWRLRGWYATVPNMVGFGRPPGRRVLIQEGSTVGFSMPNDSYYNILFSAARPDLQSTKGGIRLSGVPHVRVAGGRVDAVGIGIFNGTAIDAFLDTILVGGQEYKLAISGTYETEQDPEVPYVSSVDLVFLNPVVGSRKDRIPNRSNFPKGTPKAPAIP